MRLAIPIRQTNLIANTEKAVPLPNPTYGDKHIFKLFRYLEMHCLRNKIKAEVRLDSDVMEADQQFFAVIDPGEQTQTELDRINTFRDSFQALAIHAFSTPYCPVASVGSLDYPDLWLAGILRYFPKNRSYNFIFTEPDIYDGTDLEPLDNLLPYYFYEEGVAFVNLDAIPDNDDQFYAIYSNFTKELLYVIAELWSNKVVHMTEEQALRWQCTQYSTGLYQLQQSGFDMAFLLQRISDLPHLLWVGPNKIARHAVATVIVDPVFYRDYCPIPLESWRDYSLVRQLQKVVLSALTQPGKVIITEYPPNAKAVPYRILDDGEGEKTYYSDLVKF